jgi:pyridoxamine 5'-phosphate oxidase
MTRRFSTVDDGNPTARVLILKNLTGHDWQFATDSGSPEGRQIAAHPHAALTFGPRSAARSGSAEPYGPRAKTTALVTSWRARRAHARRR